MAKLTNEQKIKIAYNFENQNKNLAFNTRVGNIYITYETNYNTIPISTQFY